MFFGVCNQWDRHVMFTLGRFTKVVEPGLYFYIPFFQGIKRVVDTRIITYSVPLQKGLTRDNIPVEVDAIVFYKVANVEDSVLKVDNYHTATQLSVRSAIRDMVGKSTLDELLSERDKIGDIVREHTAELVTQWGVLIVTVEIKDVIVSKELEDAISREAAAEREKRARIILATAEELAVDSIVRASKKYARDPVALQLRSMNMLYEMCVEGFPTGNKPPCYKCKNNHRLNMHFTEINDLRLLRTECAKIIIYFSSILIKINYEKDNDSTFKFT